MVNSKKIGIMNIFSRGPQGQSFLEYSLLMIIIVAVFITMQMYVKRGIQGRWKSSVDEFGDQYDPRTANSFVNYSTNSSSNTYVFTVPDNNGSYSTVRVDSTNSVESKADQTTVGTLVFNTSS